jgi:hypothetical protein
MNRGKPLALTCAIVLAAAVAASAAGAGSKARPAAPGTIRGTITGARPSPNARARIRALGLEDDGSESEAHDTFARGGRFGRVSAHDD